MLRLVRTLGLVGLASCASGSPPAPASDPPAPPPTPLTASAIATAAPAPDASAAAPVDAPDVAGDVQVANTFTAHLYGKIKKTPGNVMISGSSVRQALGLVMPGARGDTARELASVLGDPKNESWDEARGKAELVVANRLWADRGLSLNQDFATSAQPVDFVKGADGARRTINQWVSEQTAQKITDLLPEGSVTSSSRLVLTNAIYFKGRWESSFKVEDTKPEPFKGKTTANVPMMHRQGRYRFAQVNGAKVLEMRYRDSQLGMLVVLPDDDKGLAKIEDAFEGSLDAWTKPLNLGRVKVTFPKLSFKWGASLTAPLGEIGLTSAFSASKADFSGITTEKVSLSQVFQKTWIAVDEQGTEAAAATGGVMTATSLEMGPVAEFKADHPFLFFVYDTKSGRILFSGRFAG